MSDTEVGDQWIDSRQLWIRAAYRLIAFGCLVAILWWLSNTSMIWILFVITIFFEMGRTMNCISKRRENLDLIALGIGHPWHDTESTGISIVYVSNTDDWVELSKGDRVVKAMDPLLDSYILRRHSIDGDVLARWSFEPEDDLISLINMAQILAEAQSRDPAAEDPIESARERENTGESLLEREWEDTEEGSSGYKPGALLRALKKSRSDDSENGEKSTPPESN
jgi:hypothetical protein